jgi:hypothetical protein
MKKKNSRSWKLVALMISISFAALFSVSCFRGPRVVIIPAGVDVLGFVQDGAIVPLAGAPPIKYGVIVTEGFVLDYRRLLKLERDGKLIKGN